MKKFLAALILLASVTFAYADNVYFYNSFTKETVSFTNVTVDYNKSANILYVFNSNKEIIFHAINVQCVGIISNEPSTNSSGKKEAVPLNWYVKML